MKYFGKSYSLFPFLYEIFNGEFGIAPLLSAARAVQYSILFSLYGMLIYER
jgi:hypothetical protein